MTAPLKWRSQLCPCGYCPDGTRIEWRYRIDIRFRPRRKDAERIIPYSKVWERMVDAETEMDP